MDIRVGYRNDEKYRKSLAKLANETFGIDLETWYQNGFWKEDYIPYSVIEDDRVVSNVSLNVCNFRWKNSIHHLAQLGTVMTDDLYRNKGYAGELIKKIINDCERSYEGIYLYCEEKNAAFYEKFGFRRTDEYQCSKKVNITSEITAEKIPMDTKDDWARMVDIIQRRAQYGERVMVGNTGLFMFYLSGIFSDWVYYVPSSEAYVVAKPEGGTLTLYAIFSDGKISLGDVISSFGKEISYVNMAFSPENSTGFDRKKITSEDNVLMTIGKAFENTNNERFMFPEISHA